MPRFIRNTKDFGNKMKSYPAEQGRSAMKEMPRKIGSI